MRSTPKIVGCYTLRPFAHTLHVVGSCLAKFETASNISFVP